MADPNVVADVEDVKCSVESGDRERARGLRWWGWPEGGYQRRGWLLMKIWWLEPGGHGL